MINLKLLSACLGILLIFLSLVLAGPTSKTARKPLPSFVKICRRNDPNLNKCVRNSLSSLKARLAEGIPELYVPAMEPLVIPEIKMNQDSGAVSMKSTYKDVHIYGLSNFNIKSLKAEVSKMKFTTNVFFKNVNITADYEIDGNVMALPLTGAGTCNANFSDVVLNIIILGERQKKYGRTYLKIKDIKVDYDVGKVKLNLNDLTSGDNGMNSFLNDNWESLADELKPLLEKSLAEVVKTSADKLFKTYSYDDILPQ